MQHVTRRSATSGRRSRRRGVISLLILLLFAGGAAYLYFDPFQNKTATPAASRPALIAVPDTPAPVTRGCALPDDILVRMWRGYDPNATDDIMIVPIEPNFLGSFDLTSHTGPWDYLQTVPLVLYGPDWIRAQGEPLDEHANLTDVYPTVERLLEAKFPKRVGNEVLDEALAARPQAPPRLVLVIMWDGVGRNVLERWPDEWPTLARLEHEGTSYLRATVGSSPSTTPATHSNLGTGTWPRAHGVVAINYQSLQGKVIRPFENGDPSKLKLTTFADEFDLKRSNAPLVGMLAWQIQLPGHTDKTTQSWHQGMLGHGAATPGGDRDHIALLGHGGVATGNRRYFEVPGYATDTPLLEDEAEKQDLADGEADGKWLGEKLLLTHNNPAWTRYESTVVRRILQREGYGTDAVPDLFFVNFKVTDIVGHNFSLDSQRMGEALKAQDEALANILDYLDEAVEDYVVIVSADHGHTPDPERSGAWPILESELEQDINDRFGIEENQTLVRTTSASGLFLKQSLLRRLDIDEEEVARFLNDMTIRDNWEEQDLPESYAERGDERLFSAAFTRAQFPEVIECAFNSKRPPLSLED